MCVQKTHDYRMHGDFNLSCSTREISLYMMPSYTAKINLIKVWWRRSKPLTSWTHTGPKPALELGGSSKFFYPQKGLFCAPSVPLPLFLGENKQRTCFARLGGTCSNGSNEDMLKLLICYLIAKLIGCKYQDSPGRISVAEMMPGHREDVAQTTIDTHFAVIELI